MQNGDEDVEWHDENPWKEKLSLVISQANNDENWWESSENSAAEEHHAEQDVRCCKTTEMIKTRSVKQTSQTNLAKRPESFSLMVSHTSPSDSHAHRRDKGQWKHTR